MNNTHQTKPLFSVAVLGTTTQPASTPAVIPLRESPFTMGRDTHNHLCLSKDSAVSRHHCAIEVIGSALFLRDLDSRNGTYLNGHRITGKVEPLQVPCSLMVGHTRLAVTTAYSAGRLIESAMDSTYCTQGSIVMPACRPFQQRIEAFLVVDIVDSTQLVRQSDMRLAEVVVSLGKQLERALRNESEPFLKCTGDGFFACFGRADAALKTSLSTASALAWQAHTQVQLSFALHWGSASLAANGDRIGKDVHAVFALEDLRHEIRDSGSTPESAGAGSFLLMTEAFWSQLDETREKCAQHIGTYHLKGLTNEQKIFRWMNIPSPQNVL